MWMSVNPNVRESKVDTKWWFIYTNRNTHDVFCERFDTPNVGKHDENVHVIGVCAIIFKWVQDMHKSMREIEIGDGEYITVHRFAPQMNTGYGT